MWTAELSLEEGRGRRAEKQGPVRHPREATCRGLGNVVAAELGLSGSASPCGQLLHHEHLVHSVPWGQCLSPRVTGMRVYHHHTRRGTSATQTIDGMSWINRAPVNQLEKWTTDQGTEGELFQSPTVLSTPDCTVFSRTCSTREKGQMMGG